jgi:nucleotide-binding universal stress UspA family protein
MKYLIPFDFSPVSVNAVKNAIKFAENAESDLFLLHIISDKRQLKAKELLLKEFIATLELPKLVTASFHVTVGDIFTDIGKIADYHGADLAIMGTHGVDTMQKLFGSNAVKIIKNSSVPFIVIQEECEMTKLKKIVMPISIEKKSMQVLRFASKLSQMYDAELHLVGRMHSDEFLKHKENVNVIVANNFLVENNIKHKFEIVDVDKSKFLEYVVDYAAKEDADLIATTYFSDAIMPVFEKFVQHLIVNPKHIPVLCVNAQSLSSIDSTLSFMTV